MWGAAPAPRARLSSSFPLRAHRRHSAEIEAAAGVVGAGRRGQERDELRHLGGARRGAGVDRDRPDPAPGPLDRQRARHVLEPGARRLRVRVAGRRRQQHDQQAVPQRTADRVPPAVQRSPDALHARTGSEGGRAVPDQHVASLGARTQLAAPCLDGRAQRTRAGHHQPDAVEHAGAQDHALRSSRCSFTPRRPSASSRS